MCAICAFLVLCFHLSFIKITEQLVQARHAARLYGRHKDACDTAADGRGQSDTCSPCVVFSRAVVSHSATPWTAACQASLSFTISRSLLKLMSSGSVMPSNHLILCCSLLLLPSFFPESGSLPMSRLFLSGGQSIGASASATENLSKLY